MPSPHPVTQRTHHNPCPGRTHPPYDTFRRAPGPVGPGCFSRISSALERVGAVLMVVGIRSWHLERWGMLEDWDRMQAEGRQARAAKRQERFMLEELERQSDPLEWEGERRWT